MKAKKTKLALWICAIVVLLVAKHSGSFGAEDRNDSGDHA